MDYKVPVRNVLTYKPNNPMIKKDYLKENEKQNEMVNF